MRTKALGAKAAPLAAGAASPAARATAGPSAMPSTSPPAPCMKRRRLRLRTGAIAPAWERTRGCMTDSCSGQRAGGFVDGGADAHIGGAPAHVAAHGGIDVGIAGLLVLGQQGGGRHDL